jgi:opacity protein-like surface antigen
MFRQLLSLGFGAALALFTNLAWPAGDWYVSGTAGATFLNDADLEPFIAVPVVPGITFPDRLATDGGFDTGFAVAGAIGRRVGDNWRLEGEIGYRRNALDRLSLVGFFTDAVDGGRGNDIGGDMSALSFMANVFYDIPLDMPLRPYLGGGVGLAHLWSSASFPNIAAAAAVCLILQPCDNIPTERFSGSDTVFAYQAGVGLAYEIISNLTASVDYRYFATSDPSFRTGGAKIDSYSTHNVSLNFRYEF